MKSLTTILLTLLMSMGAWGAEKKESTLCKGELGKKPEYKEYCAEYSKLPSESLVCKGPLGKKKEYKEYCSQFKNSDSNLKGDKKRKKPIKKKVSEKQLQNSMVEQCLERMAEAKVNFLKTCSGPATTLSTLSHHAASRQYCKNKANDRFDETQCFLSNPVTNENKTQYTLWLITDNGADRYATYDDYGQCMDTCQNLSQRCDCKAD